MDIKDYLIIGLGLLGWIWGVIQFNLKRKHLKIDKDKDRKFDVYLNLLNQIDEMSLNMRKDPKMTYGIQTEMIAELLTGDEQRMNNALLKFNSDLMEATKNSMQSIMIFNQELNKLRLVASDKLLSKINDYKVLVVDYTDEFQSILNKMSSSENFDQGLNKLQSLGQDERGVRMGVLWKEIEQIMREEI